MTANELPNRAAGFRRRGGEGEKIKISSYRVYRALWRESQVSMVTLLQAAWQKQKNM